MQSSEIVLNNLSKQSLRENYRFNRLYRNFFNSDFYYKAYSNIYANKGSATKGIDDTTADGFGEKEIKRIMDMLSDESYQPKSVRREYIPKKKGGKRPLGIPSFTDRIVQEICRVILEAIYEPVFENESHGFRPNKSCHTALRSIKMEFRGIDWFIEGDVKSYFDSIDHKVLIDILREKISDEKFLRLIWKFLRSGYIDEWKYHKTYSGTPQGGIASPILSNIYLDKLDKYILKTLKIEYNTIEPKKRKINREYHSKTYEIRKLKLKIDELNYGNERNRLLAQFKADKNLLLTIPYYEPANKEYKRIKYIRYADDWLIGICGGKQDCQDIKKKIEVFLRETLHLELSEEKTLITHSSKQAKFLGYGIRLRKEYTVNRDKNGVSKRMHNQAVQFLIPKNVIEQFIMNKRMVQDINSDKWNILHRPELLNQSELEIVKTFNAEIRGIYNFYCLAENVSVKMWQLRYVMEYSCLKTLAGKHNTSLAHIKKQYAQGKHWGIPYKTKTGSKIAYFHKEGFTVKRVSQEINLDQVPNTYIYGNRTELEQRLRAKQCEICGTTDENMNYAVHHVNKVKNLKGKKYWEQIMIARKRKTLIVCDICHTKIHAGKL